MNSMVAEIGVAEIGIIFLAILVVFGGSQIPKLARNFGSAKREFEHGMKTGYAGDTTPKGSAPDDAEPPKN
ncbi:MAG: twin-arginine translocase TatA/TatE family subunit [Acidimicrobiia bacterium]